MNIHDATLPNVIGDIHFGGITPTGWDRIVEALLPTGRFRLYVAAKILKSLPGVDRSKKITFQLNDDPRVWRIFVVDWKVSPPVACVIPWKGGLEGTTVEGGG